MIIRQICQKDYPPAGAKSACVLSCLQMIIEDMIQSPIDQKTFYELLLTRKIIRPDAYVNSYDDALRLIILRLSSTATIVNPNLIKAISEHLRQWQFSVDDMPLVLPCIAFLGGHAVLVTEAKTSEGGDIGLQIIDPNRRGAAGRYVIPRERVKKFGGFV